MAAEAHAAAGGPSSKRGKSELMLPLINTVVILCVMGLLIYTKLLYKRPAITESGERARLEAQEAKNAVTAVPGMMLFDPVTVNIQSIPAPPKSLDGVPQAAPGKLHYVTFGFALE